MLKTKKVFSAASIRDGGLQDFVKAVKKSNLTGNQVDVVQILNEKQINLGNYLAEGGEKENCDKNSA